MNRRQPILFAAALVAALITGACASSGPSQENTMEYFDALSRLEAETAPPAPGSDAERRAIERFQAMLVDFKSGDIRSEAREVYAENAFFNDTLKTVRGNEAIADYLGETADAVEETTVEFLDVVSSGGSHYFRWSMTIRAKRLAGGEPILSIGMSHIRFDRDGRVALHQDYWDSTGGLFEHVPVVGWMIGRIKDRL